jgi:hypothetical protein
MYARVLIAIMLCLATVVGSADTLFVAASAGPAFRGLRRCGAEGE